MSNLIAVAGGAGFIGGHLTRKLVELGSEIRSSSFSKTLKDEPNCDWVNADFTEYTHCELFTENVHTLYICAGATAGAGVVVKDPRALVRSNLLIYTNLFEAASRNGIKNVICMGSTTGYPEADHPVAEYEYHGKLYPGYFCIGTVKRFCEDLGKMYPEMNMTFLRASNVYGPDDCFDPVRSHVIAATIRKVAEKQDPIIVWGDGEDARDAVYIDDMVDALIRASSLEGNNAINIGVGYSMTVTDMLLLLMAHGDHRAEIIYDKTKPTLLRKREVNIRNAEALIGWTPKVAMADGLIKTLAWYKNESGI